MTSRESLQKEEKAYVFLYVYGGGENVSDFQEPGNSHFVLRLTGEPGSNLGLTAPLTGMPRGEPPLYQPPGHLGHQGLAGRFFIELPLGRSVAVAGVNRVRGSPDSRGSGGSSQPQGPPAVASSIPL